MKIKWLYEDDLIEPASNPTDLSSGILFMSKPYNVTRENVEVFEKLNKVKSEVRAETWSIHSPGDMHIRYWGCFFAVVLVFYAYVSQMYVKIDNNCHLYFICGIGLIVIFSLCLALFIYTAFRYVSTIKMKFKATKEKHKQLIIDMNWERRKMLLYNGTTTPEISHYDRVTMENEVDYFCNDIYSPLRCKIGLPYEVAYMVALWLLILYSLFQVVIWVGSSCGLE